MTRDISLLDNIRVASPCKASWEGMRGNERVRLCGQCEQNVYNISAFTREQAENLILEKEGRLCVRYYQRADGTILTSDCPVGLRAARWAAAKSLGALAAVLTFLLPLGSVVGGGRSAWGSRLRTVQPFKAVWDRLNAPVFLTVGSPPNYASVNQILNQMTQQPSPDPQ